MRSGPMVMEMELAWLEHRQRLAEAEARRRDKELWERGKGNLRQELPGPEAGAAPEPGGGAKTEWPVFSLRLGGLQLVAFRTVRL